MQNIFSFGFIKAFDSKQIRARTFKDCVISRDINSLLKMAVFGKSCYNIVRALVLSEILLSHHEKNVYVRTAVLNKMTCAVSFQLQNFRRV